MKARQQEYETRSEWLTRMGRLTAATLATIFAVICIITAVVALTTGDWVNVAFCTLLGAVTGTYGVFTLKRGGRV